MTVSIDADSTLSNVEGIDWLAMRREPHIAAQVAALTKAAMDGEITLDSVYGKRLEVVSPTRGDIFALGETYVQRVAPDAEQVVRALRTAGIRVLIVSGGIREALRPLAELVGVDDADLHAVDVHLGPTGFYQSFDAASPLIRQDGKARLLHDLGPTLPAPILHVGDGATDAVVGNAAAFAAYTGFIRRPAVVKEADFEVESFGALLELATGEGNG
jgi:phosphoserine phosphatase